MDAHAKEAGHLELDRIYFGYTTDGRQSISDQPFEESMAQRIRGSIRWTKLKGFSLDTRERMFNFHSNEQIPKGPEQQLDGPDHHPGGPDIDEPR